MVTSAPEPERENHFVSLNLAYTQALTGKRTLLIDLNFRNPQIANYLGIKDKGGLTPYLTSEDKADKAVLIQKQTEWLDVITAGPVTPQSFGDVAV